MRRSGAKCLPPRQCRLDQPCPRGEKRGRNRGEVELPGQVKMAGGVGEAACAAYHLRGFMVLVHSRRFRRARVASKVP